MANGFQGFYDANGDLHITDGVVIQRSSGVTKLVGERGVFEANTPDPRGADFVAARQATGATFVGGSGRNFISTGLAAGPVGFFRPTVADTFVLGIFTLVVTGPSAAEISDGADVVAILTTGGLAPAGDYDSTAYGETTYNASAAFVLVLAEEIAGGGALPGVRVSINHGTAQGGVYNPVSIGNYESDVDPDWTLVIDPSGSAELQYLGVAVATRAAGLGYAAGGEYVAESTAFLYNPQPPEEIPEGAAPGSNPFGILTLVYSWPATPDLDDTTTFLGGSVGFPGPYLADYMTHSGDDTGPSGSETVVIDLATAWDDGAISTFADIECFADWYPGAGGSGLATLDITYTIGALAETHSISPGGLTPSSTPVKYLRILAAGTVEVSEATWTARVQPIGRLPRTGYGYLEIVEVSGVLDEVNGPFFATTIPAAFSETSYLPLVHCDGTTIEQYVSGAVIL